MIAVWKSFQLHHSCFSAGVIIYDCALFEDASCSKVLCPLKISGQGLRHGVIHNVTIVKARSYKHLVHVVGCFDG